MHFFWGVDSVWALVSTVQVTSCRTESRLVVVFCFLDFLDETVWESSARFADLLYVDFNGSGVPFTWVPFTWVTVGTSR